MKAIIKPGYLSGSLQVPASKSIMQRACAAALLHSGTTTIRNPGFSDDEMAALNVIQQLGATIISKTEVEIIVHSKGIIPITNSIHCGESGLAARLFIPLAALSNQTVEVTGIGSLLQRPMHEFIKTLPQLGVQIQHQNECLPILIKGPLVAQNIVVDGNMSSQFLSGLLFAFAFAAKGKITIKAEGLKSKPYIDLTLQMLQLFGKEISHNNYETFYINPTIIQNKDEVELFIEADWSSAAFWIVGATMNGDVSLGNLNINSLQADKSILSAIETATRKIDFSLAQTKQQQLFSFDFDATDCPDLFPILSVLAASANGISTIKGLHRLVHKESNRQHSITEMLQKLGVVYEIIEDSLMITGKDTFEGATIFSYNDHRIVMAAAIAALKSNAPITILGAEAVSKSYPDFFKHLASLGIECDLSS